MHNLWAFMLRPFHHSVMEPRTLTNPWRSYTRIVSRLLLRNMVCSSLCLFLKFPPNLTFFLLNLGVTEAQIVLRFGYQRGYSVIPKTSKTERLKENISLFNFHLANEDMKEIEMLERNLRFNDPGQFCENAFNTFCPIFD